MKHTERRGTHRLVISVMVLALFAAVMPAMTQSTAYAAPSGAVAMPGDSDTSSMYPVADAASLSGSSAGVSSSPATFAAAPIQGLTHTFYVLYVSSQPIASKDAFLPQAHLDQLLSQAGQFWNRETNGAIDGFTYDWNAGVATWQAPTGDALWDRYDQSVVHGAIEYAKTVFPSAGIQSLQQFPALTNLLVLVRSDDPAVPPAGGDRIAGQAFPGSAIAGLSHGGFLRILVDDPSDSPNRCGSIDPDAQRWGWCFAPVTEHEFGHVLGLGHSADSTCPAPTYDGTFDGIDPSCSYNPYGDQYDIMGAPGRGYLHPLSGYRRTELGLLEQGVGSVSVSTPVSQSYTLAPLEERNFSRLNEIRITDPTDASAVYSVEYRQGKGVRILRSFVESGLMATGYLSPILNTEDTWGSARGSFLSMTDPYTADSFVSASGQIRITVTSMSATGATVEVIVNQPSSGSDDCGGSKESYCTLSLSADSPTSVTKRLETASDHDFFGFVVPATGVWTFTSSATPAGSDLKGQLLFLPWGYTSTLYWGNNGSVGGRDFEVSSSLLAGEMMFLDVSNVSANPGVNALTYTITATYHPADDCGSMLGSGCTLALQRGSASSLTKRIEFGGDEDWIAITSPVAGTWAFTASVPNTAASVYMMSIAPTDQGRALAFNGWSAPPGSVVSFQLTFTAGQTQWISVENYWLGSNCPLADPYTLTATPV